MIIARFRLKVQAFIRASISVTEEIRCFLGRGYTGDFDRPDLLFRYIGEVLIIDHPEDEGFQNHDKVHPGVLGELPALYRTTVHDPINPLIDIEVCVLEIRSDESPGGDQA